VDATKQTAGVAPVANTFETWRMELSSAGAASFKRNGKVIGTSMANAATASTLLTPVAALFSRGAVNINLEVDYLLLQRTRF
jgi:hypothetical protein